MKRKSMLLVILLCCIFNSFGAVIAAENETQSPEEIARIQAANEEYERKHPRPQHSPRPLKTFMELSTDGKSMSIGTVGAGAKTVVYKEKDSNVYHMGYCSYYAEKSNEDYSRPYWLSNIIMDGMRCSLCIDDETYYTCKEAIYRIDIEELSESNLEKKVQWQFWLIIILSVVCGILFISLAILIIKLFRYKKQELY